MPFIRVEVKYEAAEPAPKNQTEMTITHKQGSKTESVNLGKTQQKGNALLEEAFQVVRERIGENTDWKEFKVQKVLQ